MGNKKGNIQDALFSKVRQRVLGLLYSRSNDDFYMNEIIRWTASGTGAVQRELENLAAAGLITIKQIGNQKRYQANQTGPFFAELQGIVLKTFGLADVIRDALNPIRKKIHIAFIYGSIAKQKDTASSDIDVILIGDNLTYAEVFHQLEKSEAKLGRKINPTFYSLPEWMRKKKEGNSFITKILKQPMIFLIGSEDELGKFK